MKLGNNMNFPYPILLENGGDYKDSSFIVEATLTITDTTIDFSFDNKIQCSFVEQLVKDGFAQYIVHVEQRTFRKSGLLNDFSINKSEISPDNNIELTPMVIATKNFDLYPNEQMSEVHKYFDEPFKIKKGNMIGFGSSLLFSTPPESKNSSIFTISKLKDKKIIGKNIPFILNLEGNIINISILPEMYDIFLNKRSLDFAHNKMYNSVFVYPAIQLAIVEMLKNYETYKDYKWCIALSNALCNHYESKTDVLINQNRIDKDTIIEYTNVILKDLMLNAFQDLGGNME